MDETRKGAIFDMDGTMYDSELIWRDIWYHLPEEYGYDVDPTLGEDMCGTSGEGSVAVAARHYPDLDAHEFMRRGVGQYRERVLAAQPKEKPGLHELLHYLKEQGYHIAVASGSELELIQINMKRGGIDDIVEATVSGYDVPKGKPAPDIFLEAAKQIQCDPHNCIVIEDGENGIRAAVAAGCTAYMVPDLSQPSEEVRKLCSSVYNSMLDIVGSL